jgi:hypothetical protein
VTGIVLLPKLERMHAFDASVLNPLACGKSRSLASFPKSFCV